MIKLVKKRGIIKISCGSEVNIKKLHELILDLMPRTYIILLEISSINKKIDDILDLVFEMGFFFSGIDFNNNSTDFFLVLQYISREKLINIEKNTTKLYIQAERIKKIVDKSRVIL